MAIRAALGAGRIRLLRQMTIEAVILALAAGMAGLFGRVVDFALHHRGQSAHSAIDSIFSFHRIHAADGLEQHRDHIHRGVAVAYRQRSSEQSPPSAPLAQTSTKP